MAQICSIFLNSFFNLSRLVLVIRDLSVRDAELKLISFATPGGERERGAPSFTVLVRLPVMCCCVHIFINGPF